LAGEDAGVLSESAADSLGLPAGTPVAAGEGDQPAALTGSLISASGTVSVSFGTSVCANSVGDRPFQGVDRAVDHFCAPDGKPINMVWLRNGTTFMNVVMDMFGDLLVGNRQSGFDQVIPALLQAPAECGGLLALPFMDDEPGLGVHRGGTAMVVGLNKDNATAGNLAKAALLATMFNLRLGCQVLDRQGFPRNQMVLTGGLTKTPQLAQILADVFATPVRLLAGSDEGTAWGAAVLAKYRYLRQHETLEWGDFLDSLQPSQVASYQPDPGTAKAYDRVFLRYTRLMELQERLDQAVAPHNGS
jgi:xylulokinase